MGLRRKSAGSVVVRMDDAIELCVCWGEGMEGGEERGNEREREQCYVKMGM